MVYFNFKKLILKQKRKGRDSMRKTYIIITLAIIAIIAGITIGFMIANKGETSNLQQGPESTLAKSAQNMENEIQIVTTSNMEIKTSPNTLFIFQIHYKECDHTIIKREEISQEEVNQTEEDLQEKYRDWAIQEFTDEQVVFYQEQEGICNEHYILKDTNGYVTIYNVDSTGKETLQEVTEIVTNYLPETDKIQLKEGIQINGQDKLNAALEDYE